MAHIKRVNLPYSKLNQMKKLSWLLACFFTLSLSAQEKFVLMGKAPDLYVVHTADGKENLQSISILFGQSVSKLAAYNSLTASTPLAKGTAVKIPVSKDNIIQQRTESGAPVYHMIGKGDNLYRISQLYNKVPINTIKDWNAMKSDVVKDGQLLIIGYMVNAPTAKATSVIVATGSGKTELRPDPLTNDQAKKNDPKAFVPVGQPLDNYEYEKQLKLKEQAKAREDSAKLKKLEAKPDPKKDIPAFNGINTPNTTPEKKYIDKSQPLLPKQAPANPIVATELIKTPVKINTENKSTAKAPAPVTKPAEKADYTPSEGDEGYFASAYAQHPKEAAQQFHSGDAAVFKTISGWTDRKYYVLMNDIEPRTIVRITGPANKSICAMVLGPLQETKGASGLLLRISNSAAAALSITDAKFTLTVTYFE